MLSQTLEECLEKIENTLADKCSNLDQELLCNLIVGIRTETIRAYVIGFKEGREVERST